MADPSNNKNRNDVNLFRIIDGIIYQLNKTKKMFIVMILTIMILPPVTLLISSLIFAPPYDEESTVQKSFKPPEGKQLKFFNLRIIPLIISAVWLAIGIRQWFVLSTWTKKYERYKKLQDELDKKLDDDNNGDSPTR
jgi:hypothetical protein